MISSGIRETIRFLVQNKLVSLLQLLFFQLSLLHEGLLYNVESKYDKQNALDSRKSHRTSNRNMIKG
jgi:deoxyhypusine synthase